MAKRTKRTEPSAIEPKPAIIEVVRSAGQDSPLVDARLAWIDRMRPFRCRHDRDVSMEPALKAIEREFRQQNDAVGDVIDAWNAVAAPQVRSLATIAGVTQGTLTLVVHSSGASYELSRALRGGLERELMRRLPARVKRIKVRVAAE